MALSFSLWAKGDREAGGEQHHDCDELHLKGEQRQVRNADPVHLSDEAEKAQVDSCKGQQKQEATWRTKCFFLPIGT